MKLFYSRNSPYVRKVMVVLQETGQSGDVELVNVSGTPLDPDGQLLDRNPLTKIPALEVSDGTTLFDSRVICAFLDDRANGGLYPGGEDRWKILTLEALADGMTDAALLIAYEWRLRPEEKRMDEMSDAQWAKVSQGCAALNAHWMEFLNGPLNIGQIAVACALGYIDFRHYARGWRNGNDALAAWFKGFESRPSMAESGPPKV